MKVIYRSIHDQLYYWRLWVPLFALTVLVPVAGLALPVLEKQIIDDVLVQHRFDRLAGAVLAYGGAWFVAMGAGTARTVLQIYLGDVTTNRLRERLLAHLTALSLPFLHRENSGRVMSLFQNDAGRVTGIFGTVFVGGLAGIIGLALGSLIMLSFSWQLAVAAAVALPLVTGLSVIATRPLRPASRRVQDKIAQVSESLQQNLSGLREVIAFGQEKAQSQQFAATLSELVRLRLRVTGMDAAFSSGQNVLSLAVSLIILGYGGYLYMTGATTLGTVVAMRTLFGQLIVVVSGLFGIVRDAQMSLASADRVYAFLDEQPQVSDRAGVRAPENLVGSVTFDRVSFAYNPGNPVVRDVSFSARPGELTALVGPSGAGKSTVVGLVARFYDPSEGRVLLDGVDMRDLALAGIRRDIGFVFQDTFLFDTTIRENIAFGDPEATDDQIVRAAQEANAWEFIERFPKGLETMVGERGVQLSEGQRQRLAIARALLKNPRILILDEPSSALDARSERLLQTAIENLMRQRTTFVIAHRLATVVRANQILVFDEGHLVEKGSHAVLYQRHGLYRDLCDLQFAGLIPPMETLPDSVAPELVPVG